MIDEGDGGGVMVNIGQGTRVLVVEDEDDMLAVVKLYLTMLGFEVETATDGAEALARVQNDALPQLDVIMLDLMMPVMTGFEFMRRYEGPIPIVLMSAWTDMSELPREPFGRVVKPGDIQDEVAPLLMQAAASRRKAA